MNLRAFYDGKEFETFEYLGAHCLRDGVVFRTYAPAADAVSVIGEFSDWKDCEMHRVENGQFWEAKIANAKPGQMYKYKIYHNGGNVDHADPYAFFSEKRPGTASVIYDEYAYQYHDAGWMRNRSVFQNKPLNIYELHLGSWKRKDDPDQHVKELDEAKEKGVGIDVSDGWYHYDEIGDLLIPYLKENHYNSVEFMPLNEYPADESWGYQGTGFFSATSRYGHLDGLKSLIDRLHQEKISVILDVVTVHFATNYYGLANYDGTPLFEYPNDAVGMSEWGSCNFNHSRGDIASFLNSASAFWLREYHFDGLRFDAVGNLIYWQGDQKRGVNTNTVEFIRNMNEGLKKLFPSAMLIAEDSSAYPGVTKPVSEGGLGFDYKWDMGWMNDTLDFFRTDPEYRRENYHKLTFSMAYFYNEKYLLPFSHDEVVHGKATILQKMAGSYEMKFPQGRALYLYMFTHPGKKLNFMGNEIGQLREWDEKREQDWMLTQYPLHDSFHHFIMDLNEIYLGHPSLWERDYEKDGFRWLEADDTAHVIYAYLRNGGKEQTLTVLNFSGQPQHFLYHEGGDLQLLIDTDNTKYSGNTSERGKTRISSKNGAIDLVLPAFSGRLYVVN